jgi:hypothetical protein
MSLLAVVAVVAEVMQPAGVAVVSLTFGLLFLQRPLDIQLLSEQKEMEVLLTIKAAMAVHLHLLLAVQRTFHHLAVVVGLEPTQVKALEQVVLAAAGQMTQEP